MNKELESFIANARKKKMDHGTIRMLLLSAGWKEKDIAQALSAEGLDMPVPLPPDVGSARDAFFHLLTFVGLYTTVISLIILFFAYINRLFPDPALNQPWRSDADFSVIRWSMAAIIVAFPLLLWLSRKLNREMREHPERAVSGIRRWLTYLTLFIAAAAMMGDVITLIFYLLEGELSVRFFLKVGVILGLAGLVFTYYLQSLRLQPKDPALRKSQRTFLITACVIVLGALVWGVVIVGSPGTERERKFDERRLEDIQSIVREVVSITYGGARPIPPSAGERAEPQRAIPQTLEEIQKEAYYQMPDIRDPETGEPYAYTVQSDTRFQICAVYAFAREERYDVRWNHPAGRHCFAVDVTDEVWR